MTLKRLAEIKAKLEEFDDNNEAGSWTYRVLSLIRNNPKAPINDLAEITGTDEGLLQSNIEKLMGLGLVFSHTKGYSLSPLGKDFLKQLSQ